MKTLLTILMLSLSFIVQGKEVENYFFNNKTPSNVQYESMKSKPQNTYSENSEWVSWLQKWASQGNNYLASDWTTILGWSSGQAQYGYGYSNEQYNTYYGYMNSNYFQNWYSQLQSGQRTDWEQFWNELDYNNNKNLPIGDEFWPFVTLISVYILYKIINNGNARRIRTRAQKLFFKI